MRLYPCSFLIFAIAILFSQHNSYASWLYIGGSVGFPYNPALEEDLKERIEQTSVEDRSELASTATTAEQCRLSYSPQIELRKRLFVSPFYFGLRGLYQRDEISQRAGERGGDGDAQLRWIRSTWGAEATLYRVVNTGCDMCGRKKGNALPFPLTLGVGAGYHYSSIEMEVENNLTNIEFAEDPRRYTGAAFSGHVLLETEFSLTRILALVIGVKGSYGPYENMKSGSTELRSVNNGAMQNYVTAANVYTMLAVYGPW